MKIINDFTPVNFEPTRYGTKIDTIVFHSMDGFYKGTIAWFKNPNAKASCHYLISKEGEIRCMVREEHRAWHAGTWNNRSIGIELEDELEKSAWKYTQPQIDALRWLVQDIQTRHAINQFKLHKNLSSSRSDPVGNFTLDWILPVDNSNMEDKKLAMEMRKLIQHNSTYSTADNILKEISKRDSAIGEKDSQIKELKSKIVVRTPESYRLDWKEVATGAGEDENDPKFDDYKAIDQLVDKRVKEWVNICNKDLKEAEIENMGLIVEKKSLEATNQALLNINNELKKKLAECNVEQQNGNIVITFIKYLKKIWQDS